MPLNFVISFERFVFERAHRGRVVERNDDDVDKDDDDDDDSGGF